jgi:hypothetical protein
MGDADPCETVDSRLRRLIVFADDWGRHPSSAQHIVRELVPRYQTFWINTIGTRSVSFSVSDARKVAARLPGWLRGASKSVDGGPSVLSPPMWPGFRTPWQRTMNQWLISRAVNRALGVRLPNEYRVVLTTLPTTADLQRVIDADRWIYYRVDDFSSWPGVDNAVMAEMESQLIASVDCVVAASDVLGVLPGAGRAAGVVTHGVDLAHWRTSSALSMPAWWRSLRRPIFLFWGLIDSRLDVEWCTRLKQQLGSEGSIVLLGPRAASVPAMPPGIVMPGPQPYADLPRFAQGADVLLFPYAATASTQTIQPLKLKEYLATGKPVVGRMLPSIREWADAADLVEQTDDFVALAVMRGRIGIPAGQRHARNRLACESWPSKAEQLEGFLRPGRW